MSDKQDDKALSDELSGGALSFKEVVAHLRPGPIHIRFMETEPIEWVNDHIRSLYKADNQGQRT